MFAMKMIATRARICWPKGTFDAQKRPFLAFFAAFSAFSAFAVLGVLGGCSALPDKPTRAALYDFGLAAVPVAAPQAASGPPLALEDISTPGGALDNTAVLYRLGYADVQQLRPYALARWAMPPAQLLRQRLKERIGQNRPVFNAGEGVALERSASAARAGVATPATTASTTAANPLLLRVELEEFSQLFDAPASSQGVVRLRATLVALTPGGERLLGQRLFALQQPAPSPDAAGGVRALTTASDAAIEALVLWLDGLR